MIRPQLLIMKEDIMYLTLCHLYAFHEPIVFQALLYNCWKWVVVCFSSCTLLSLSRLSVCLLVQYLVDGWLFGSCHISCVLLSPCSAAVLRFSTAEVFSIELCVFLFKGSEHWVYNDGLAAPQFLSSYLPPHDFLHRNGGLRFNALLHKVLQAHFWKTGSVLTTSSANTALRF